MYRDLVLRWIHQLSALIARLLRGDPSASISLVREHLADARAQVLGPIATLAPHLDPEPVAALLGDPFRIHGYAQIEAFESALARLDGDLAAARRLTERALSLARLAVDRADPVPEDWRTWIGELEANLTRPSGDDQREAAGAG